jgi:3-deoxy-manno-octulosonate cytidylyltransferase (CMP-KDO synthetase)
MVVRVVKRLAHLRVNGQPVQVVVACDAAEIMQACNQHDVRAILTSSSHASGSDRLAEACEILGLQGDDIVVNVQGDEPLIDPQLVGAVATLLQANTVASMATAAHPIGSAAEFNNPNVVKVVLDAASNALYFSRAAIPFARDLPGQDWWQGASQQEPFLGAARPLRHIGIYAYRARFLRSFPSLPQAPIEQVEALEQMRAMWHGHRIAVHVTTDAPGPGVDTADDLERVRKLVTANHT